MEGRAEGEGENERKPPGSKSDISGGKLVSIRASGSVVSARAGGRLVDIAPHWSTAQTCTIQDDDDERKIEESRTIGC